MPITSSTIQTPLVNTSNYVGTIFNSGTRAILAHRYTFGSITRVYAMVFVLVRTGAPTISDSVEVNLYADNGANYPDFSSLIVSNASRTEPPSATAQSFGFTGTSMSSMPVLSQRRIGPVFEPEISVPAGTYWMVGNVVSASTYANLQTSVFNFQDTASPPVALYGPTTGSLVSPPVEIGDTDPSCNAMGFAFGTPTVVATPYAYAAVIG